MNGKSAKPAAPVTCTYGPDEYWEKLKTDMEYRKKCRMGWAALIECVYEADPLKCPNCGGTMKDISFIEGHQSDVIEKILRHCGLWKEFPPRAPSGKLFTYGKPSEDNTLDYDFSQVWQAERYLQPML